jgi:hypothetical protein
MVSSDHYNPPAGLSRSVVDWAHRHRSAAAQPQGGHSKSVLRRPPIRPIRIRRTSRRITLTQRKKIGTVLSRDETTFTPGCLQPLNVGAGTTDKGHWRDKSAVPIAKQNVSIKPQRIVANAPHFEEVASEAKSRCQHGVFPGPCIFRWRVDPFETARRARFHKLGRKATQRFTLISMPRWRAFSNRRRPPAAFDHPVPGIKPSRCLAR